MANTSYSLLLTVNFKKLRKPVVIATVVINIQRRVTLQYKQFKRIKGDIQSDLHLLLIKNENSSKTSIIVSGKLVLSLL